MAISITLPDDAGPIQVMHEHRGSLEVYGTLATYEAQSPEQIDPGRTVPNMPFAYRKVSNAGTANPIVARVYLQAIEGMRQGTLRRGDKVRILEHLHDCKTEILACEEIYLALKAEWDAVHRRAEAGEFRAEERVLAVPHIERLQDRAKAFLTSAKRAMAAAGEVFNEFYGLGPNPPVVSNGNFDFALRHLERSDPRNEQFIQFLQGSEWPRARLTALRNGVEHNTNARTVIRDFHLGAEGRLETPDWTPAGGETKDLVVEMGAIVQFILGFAELTFLSGLGEHIEPMFAPFAWRIGPIPEERHNPNFPMKYEVALVRVERESP